MKLIYFLRGENTCNSYCNCDFVKYSPVCGENDKTYISPCHAGCSVAEKIDGKTVCELNF